MYMMNNDPRNTCKINFWLAMPIFTLPNHICHAGKRNFGLRCFKHMKTIEVYFLIKDIFFKEYNV